MRFLVFEPLWFPGGRRATGSKKDEERQIPRHRMKSPSRRSNRLATAPARLRRSRLQENLLAVCRRILLSAFLAVGGTLLLTACSQKPNAVAADQPKSAPATAKHQNYTETLVAPDGAKIPFEMIAVPGGEF